MEKFNNAGTVVLGVSPDSIASHVKFITKYDLNFPLLSDKGAKLARLYGVWKEKTVYGKTFLGIDRSTFIIDKSGLLSRVFTKVQVEGHADEVLDAVLSGR